MSRMSKRREREIENATRNRREIIEAKLTRRDLMKMGLLTSAGYLIEKHGLSAHAFDKGSGGGGDGGGGGNPVSPPTTAFMEPLPIPQIAQPVPSLNPAPQPNPIAGEGRALPHQRWAEFLPQKFYDIHQFEAQHSFHSDLPLNNIWGFNGTFPGPTFHARYGEPILVRRHNDLPANHVGFGIPQTTTHLHNGHTPSESDGFPGDFFDSGLFYDQRYPNALAGFDAFPGTRGDVNEALSTLWYHDHRFDFTAQNVYKGLAGFYLLFDDRDSGDETDPNPNAFRLPSGEFDIPLLFSDKVFDSSGQLFFDLFNLDGILGDKFAVNGKIQPVLKVARRKYRFRMIDGGPSRFYEFFLSNGQPFTQIANDGNLLPAPLTRTSFRLGVAERVDVIIDFSSAKIGDQIFLQNRLQQTDGRKPGAVVAPGTPVLRFDVDRDAPDPSRVPATLRVLPNINLNQVAQTRTWRFERTNGAWAINGKFFNVNEVRASPKRGTAEIWVLQNNSGGWVHPIHIHFEEFQILSRNGVAPPPDEHSRKDVLRLGPNEEVRLFMRFRDFTGKHPMHCHNLVHEDHTMMLRWDIMP